jgi:hypothetical protein
MATRLQHLRLVLAVQNSDVAFALSLVVIALFAVVRLDESRCGVSIHSAITVALGISKPLHKV